MEVIKASLPGVLLFRPRVFTDARGSFLETWRRDRYREAGVPGDFVQDNTAVSARGVLRGLHFQHPQPQGKLVTAVYGHVFDVAVDIRPDSPHFRAWFGAHLRAERGDQMWIPEGFAHGYTVLSEVAVFSYKCTRTYTPEWDAVVRYDDSTIGIEWPLDEPILSEKDASAPTLSELPEERLPTVAAR